MYNQWNINHIVLFFHKIWFALIKKFVFDLEIKYISRQHDREIFFLQYAMYKFTCNRMTHPKR